MISFKDNEELIEYEQEEYDYFNEEPLEEDEYECEDEREYCD